MAFYSLASGSRSRARPPASGPPSAPSALGSDSASAAASYRIYGKADDNFAINVREGVLCFLDTLVLSGADEALEHMLVNVLKENMGHRWPEQQPRHHLRRGIPSASLLQLPPQLKDELSWKGGVVLWQVEPVQGPRGTVAREQCRE